MKKHVAAFIIMTCVVSGGMLGVTCFVSKGVIAMHAATNTTSQTVGRGETVTASLGNLSVTQLDYDQIFDWNFSGTPPSISGTIAKFTFNDGTVVDFIVTASSPKAHTQTSHPPVTYVSQKFEHGISINGGDIDYFSDVTKVISYNGAKRSNTFSDTTIIQTSSDILTFSIRIYYSEEHYYTDTYDLDLSGLSGVTIEATLASFIVTTSTTIVFKESVVAFVDIVNGNIVAEVETVNRYIPANLIPDAPEINQRPFSRWTNAQGFDIGGVIPYDMTFMPLYGYDPSYQINSPTEPPDETATDEEFGLFQASVFLIFAGIIFLLLLVSLFKGVLRL